MRGGAPRTTSPDRSALELIVRALVVRPRERAWILGRPKGEDRGVWQCVPEFFVDQPGAVGLKGSSRSSPGRTMRAVPAGTSRQTPGRSPSGSDTITRDSSEKIEKRSSSG